MSLSSKTIVVLGSGPKIGRHVAALFATHGFDNIALLARNVDRLRDDQEFVLEQAKKGGAKRIAIKVYPVDLQADPQDLKDVLSAVENDLGPPEVVVYNASKLEKSAMFEYTENALVENYKVSGCFLILSGLAVLCCSNGRRRGHVTELIEFR